MPIRVLVIDSDPDALDLFGLLLANADMQVSVAASAREGLQAVRDGNPDVVVLDLTHGPIESRQMCRAIRSFSRVPILVLSAMRDPGLVADILDIGADRFLSKPVSAAELVSNIRSLTRRATGQLRPVQAPTQRPASS